MRARFPLCLAMLLLVVSVRADDWPQWLGPQRDSVWREEGIVDHFPDRGLAVQWRAEVGLGYSGPAVASGRVYLMDYQLETGTVHNDPGARDKLTGRERVLCFAAKTGKLLWQHAYDRPIEISFGGGPRCTPAVVDGKVYALGAMGNLWCLNAADGAVVWSVDFVQQYKANVPLWGFTAHPLVDGNQVFCVVGGENTVAVAFDKQTGRQLWTALSAKEQGYCPPTMIEHAGTRQLLIWHGDALSSLNPRTGALYWSAEVKPSYGMAITAPRKLGSQLFVSGYGSAALLKLDDAKPAADIQWRAEPKQAIFCANSTPFLQDNMIYGCDVQTGALMGVRLTDGERLWQTREPTSGGERRDRYGTAFIVKHKDRFFLFSEQGDLILATLSPQGYTETSRFHVLEPTKQVFGRAVVWSHPAFAQRCLFARNDKELVCVSLAGTE